LSRNGPSSGTEFETDIGKLHCSFDSFYNAKKQIGPSYGKYLVSGILVALALLIPSMIDDAYADVPISSCGTLDIKGETYVLTKDLTSSGTCFTITAGGITLDGNGHTITGSDSLWGVNVRQYASGVTVKNLNISGFTIGIYVSGSDTLVINNTLTNMSWAGIEVSNSCGGDYI